MSPWRLFVTVTQQAFLRPAAATPSAGSTVEGAELRLHDAFKDSGYISFLVSFLPFGNSGLPRESVSVLCVSIWNRRPKT